MLKDEVAMVAEMITAATESLRKEIKAEFYEKLKELEEKEIVTEPVGIKKK